MNENLLNTNNCCIRVGIFYSIKIGFGTDIAIHVTIESEIDERAIVPRLRINNTTQNYDIAYMGLGSNNTDNESSMTYCFRVEKRDIEYFISVLNVQPMSTLEFLIIDTKGKSYRTDGVLLSEIVKCYNEYYEPDLFDIIGY